MINQYLNEFFELEKKYPGIAQQSISLDFKKHKGHIIFGAMIHGNETGSLPAMIRFVKKLLSQEILYDGRVSFFLGNVEAAKKDLRFIDFDLNRSFGHQFQGPNESMERKRALNLMPLLSSADVFFDFHQTIMPSLKPFYIFEMDEPSYYWARAAGVAKTLVTRRKGAAFSSAGMCSDEFMRAQGKVGITIELGEKGFHKDAEFMAFEIMRRSIFNMDKVCGKYPIPVQKLARRNNELEFLYVKHREPFSHPLKKLNEGFCNFNKVTKGMILGVDEKNKPLKAPLTGYILFPKYPVREANGEAKLPLPGEIFVIAGER